LLGEVFQYDKEATPTIEDLDRASRANTTTMKKIKVGGLVG